MKMSTVADQANDQEIELLGKETIETMYNNYTSIFESLPPAGEEATIEQLTSVSHLVSTGQPPYVDFAVFGPHGYRMQRRLKLAGLQICAGGELRHVELTGPPTFQLWEKRYKCIHQGR